MAAASRGSERCVVHTCLAREVWPACGLWRARLARARSASNHTSSSVVCARASNDFHPPCSHTSCEVDAHMEEGVEMVGDWCGDDGR